MGSVADTVQAAPESAWKPLRRPLFRAVWIASVASQIGTWVHDVGAAWLMATLSLSPIMIALVQAANTLPLFLLAIPAGALADVVDRRRLLVVTQSWMVLVALLLAASTWHGHTSPAVLLAFTVAMSIGAALNAPAWQATTPELVPEDELPLAVSLNGMAINLSRSVGPAIGGLLVGLSGSQSAFLLNALSYLGVLVVLIAWRREPKRSTLPAERFSNALRAGIRYARYAEGFRSVLMRAVLFLFPASALWALLPLVAKVELEMSALGYGVLMAAVGIGALLSASVLPRLRAALSQRILTFAAALIVSAAIAGLALAPSPYAAWPILLVLGSGWLVMLSSLNMGAQASAAGWARARALSVFLLVFFGSLSLGSLAWGALGEFTGVRSALLAAGGLTALCAVPALFFPLPAKAGKTHAPSMHWPVPDVSLSAEDDRGPVMIVIDYKVSRESVPDLFALLAELRISRLRDGGFGWNALEDAEEPGCVTEVFHAESWTEHLRQHERVTIAEKELQAHIRRLQSEPGFPRVRHFIASRGADG